MKKILLFGLGLSLLGVAKAQTSATEPQWLENIIVEKYYVSTQADADASEGVLPVGSVTYRVFVDMLPGCKFLFLWGETVSLAVDHPLIIKTSTSFFNHEGYGDVTPSYTKEEAKQNNTLLLDSWFSSGSACVDYWAVTKTEDDSLENIASANTDGLFKNTDPAMGIPLTQQDGMIAIKAGESIQAVDFAPGMNIDIFKDQSQKGSVFNSTSASIGPLLGVSGPTATNRVLIGQFTTDGKFEFELNVALTTPTMKNIRYAARQDLFSTDPSNLQFYLPFLKYPLTSDENNLPPTVQITSPGDNTKYNPGDNIVLKIKAADVDGTVKKVYVPDLDGYELGADSSLFDEITIPGSRLAPGYNTLKAIAVDDKGNQGTSTPVIIYISGGSVAPYVAINNPANLSQHQPNTDITLTAAVYGADTTIKSVEFFKQNSSGADISIGEDSASPYEVTYKELSTTDTNAVFKVRVIDNKGRVGEYNNHVLLFSSNTPPAVAVKSPVDGAKVKQYTDTTIVVDATDNSKVSLVEYFIDGIKIGEDGLWPFQLLWKPTQLGIHEITAIATDDKGLKSKSIVSKVEVEKPDGIAIYSKDVQSIKLYPNPVKDILSFEFNSGNSGNYFLYNAQGQLLKTGKLVNGSGKATENIDVTDYSSGNYILELIIDGKQQSAVVIKQ